MSGIQYEYYKIKIREHTRLDDLIQYNNIEMEGMKVRYHVAAGARHTEILLSYGFKFFNCIVI